VNVSGDKARAVAESIEDDMNDLAKDLATKSDLQQLELKLKSEIYRVIAAQTVILFSAIFAARLIH
jgi:hypothetical protein